MAFNLPNIPHNVMARWENTDQLLPHLSGW